MKVAFYSGTFDPFHLGHQAFVAAVLNQELAEQIMIAPEPETWRKSPVASYAQRLAMLRRLYENEKRVEVIDSVEQGLGKKHSVQATISWLNDCRRGDEIGFMMGGDVFEHAGSWQDFELLKKRAASWIVGLRTEDEGETAVKVAAELDVPLRMVSADHPTLASSSIRNSGAALGNFVDQSVVRYVEKNALYR